MIPQMVFEATPQPSQRRRRAGGTVVVAGGLALALALLALGACDRPDDRRVRPFVAVHVFPQSEAGGAAAIYLNQEIEVRFNDPVERISVTPDTVRVLDAFGQRVEGKLRVSSHAVTFVPRAPVTPALDDGSFRPGEEYRLEVRGFPIANAVRSRAGRVLDEGFTRRFRAVGVDAKPAPLLKAATSPYGFALDGDSLAMAADSRVLRLMFHEAPLPTTITPAAFRLYRVGDNGAVQAPLQPRETRLRQVDAPYGQAPWVVELEFDSPPVAGPGYCGLELVADEAVCVRDPAGQPPHQVVTRGAGGVERMELLGLKLLVEVFAGARVPLLVESFNGSLGLAPTDPAALGFEARAGAAVPRVRTLAGGGGLGVFAPSASTDLVIGQPFDRGDGVRVRADGDWFDFAGVVIPKGVTVRLRARGDRPPRIRVRGSVHIEGVLIVEGAPSGTWPTQGMEVAAARLIEECGAVVVAGGDILVAGAIRDGDAVDGEAGSRLLLIAGGGIGLVGTVPPRTVLATDDRGAVAGSSQQSVLWVRLAPMLGAWGGPGAVRAAAVTSWIPLPRGATRVREVVAAGDPGVRVSLQFAAPDATAPGRPADAEGQLSPPLGLPLSAAVEVPSGGFVRFFLTADVHPGAPLPTLRSVTLY